MKRKTYEPFMDQIMSHLEGSAGFGSHSDPLGHE